MGHKTTFFQKIVNRAWHRFGKAKLDEQMVPPYGPYKSVLTSPKFQETAVIRDYYNKKELPLRGDMVEDIVNWVIKTAMNKLTNSMLPSQIYDILMNGSKPNQLDEIIKTLDDVERKIDELSAKTTMFKYEDVINSRNKYVSEMANAQLETNARLAAADPNDTDAVGAILQNWANNVQISGNPSLAEYLNFIDFIVDNKNDGMTLYDIYDRYVYLTTPWENMGYDFREQIRLADFSIIATQGRLAILHYAYNEPNDAVREVMIERIKKALNKYGDYYDLHRVVRNEGMAVCQIPGCKFEMAQQLEYRDYKNHPWFANETYWYTPDYQESRHIGDFEGSIFALTMDPERESRYNGTFTEDEVNTLKQYYNGKYSSLADMLKNDAGCSFGYTTNNAMVAVQGKPYLESESWDNGNWYVIMRAVKMSSDFSTGWYKIGDAWLKRYGFMWAKRMFMWWDTYYSENTWFFAKISKRMN